MYRPGSARPGEAGGTEVNKEDSEGYRPGPAQRGTGSSPDHSMTEQTKFDRRSQELGASGSGVKRLRSEKGEEHSA